MPDADDLAAVLAAHGPDHLCDGAWWTPADPCLPYCLAARAQQAEAAVARVEAKLRRILHAANAEGHGALASVMQALEGEPLP